jgi:hypothetical protein
MIFFPSFAILVLSMILFSWCTYQDNQTDSVLKTQTVSLVVMVSSFVVVMTDTIVHVVGSTG